MLKPVKSRQMSTSAGPVSPPAVHPSLNHCRINIGLVGGRFRAQFLLVPPQETRGVLRSPCGSVTVVLQDPGPGQAPHMVDSVLYRGKPIESYSLIPNGPKRKSLWSRS